MNARLLLPAVLAACAPGARGAAVSAAPTQFTTYRNAAQPEDPSCGQGSYCDAYELVWPAGTRVRVELRADFPTALQVDRKFIDGVPAEVADGAPGRPAVIEFVADGTTYKVFAAADRHTDWGDYALVVGPPPKAELLLPAPPMPVATRVEQLLARHPALPGFAMKARDRDRRLREVTGNHAAEGEVARVALDAAGPAAMTVEAGHCYVLAYQLEPGAAYSELARRGLGYAIDLPGKRDVAGRFEVLGATGVTERFCADESGEATVDLAATVAPRERRGDLGAGAARLLRWRRAVWPGLHSRAEHRGAVRKAVRGMARGRTVRGDLAAPAPLAVPVQRGRCYAVVLELAPAARWSEAAARNNIGFTFDGVDADLSAGPGVHGPGAVSEIGCPERSQRYTLTLKAYGGDAGLGTGAYTLAVYSRPARPGEVAREARMWRESAEDSRRDGERRKREHCAKCRRENYADQAGFETCVRQFYRTDDCY